MIEFATVAAPLLAIVSFVLICLGFTKLGRMKIFRFTLGEFALVTAILYGFQTVLGISGFAPFCLAIWFFIGSINFAAATWSATT